MKQNSSSGGMVQKGFYVKAGENLDFSATSPQIPNFLCRWDLPPTLLCICVGLNQHVHEAHQVFASSYKCKILHFTPRVTQGGPSRANLGLHLPWGSHPILLPAPKQWGWNLLLINTLFTRTRRSTRGCWPLGVGRNNEVCLFLVSFLLLCNYSALKCHVSKAILTR